MKSLYLRFTFLILFVFVCGSLHAQDSLIKKNSTWKYLANGSNQATAWRATTFSDASWSTGNAELGYGDGDETTVVSYGSNASNKYITTYFRKAITISSTGSYTGLTLGILRDDGAVVYVNGTERFRTNMPTGSIGFKTLASSTISGTGETTYNTVSLLPSYFTNGTNVIAVEVHQVSKTDADVSFNLYLYGTLAACGVPTGVTTSSITSSSALVSWTAATGGPSSYDVQYRKVGDLTWTGPLNTTSTSLTISGLNYNTNYEAQVRTNCVSGNQSAYSSSVTFTTTFPACSVPANRQTTNITTSDAKVSWDAQADASSYDVQYRVVGAPSWNSAINTTSTSLLLSPLNYNTTYEWQVRSNCIYGNQSAWSLSTTFTTLTPPCDVPINQSSSNVTTSSADVAWDPINGGASYDVQYRIVGNPSWTGPVNTANTSTTLGSLNYNSDYEWQVRTNCVYGNQSGWSGSKNFHTLTPPCDVPVNLTFSSITSSSAIASWSTVTGASSYDVIYRAVGNQLWTGPVNTTTTSLTLSGLNSATQYEAEVRTNCIYNQSAYCAARVFTTLAQPCDPPTGLTTTSISSSGAVLSWNAAVNAVSYKVFYRVVGNPSWSSVTVTSTTTTLASLSANTNYEWYVVTYCTLSTSGNSATATFSTLPSLTVQTVIAAGASWKYRDKGEDLNTAGAWTAIAYDDSQWASGNAELGYGDGDEATTVAYGPDANNKYITTYFRKAFTIANPSDFVTMTMSVVRDDGVIVYLNGAEIYRQNMPTGSVTYTTLASSAVADEAAWYSSSFSSSLLVAGTNEIAVEIHQSAVTSSDISFNFKLTGSTIPTVTRGAYLQSPTPTSMIIRWRTDVATASRVRVGPSTSNYNMTFYDASSTTEHIVQVSGLTAATKYFYTVETGSIVLQGDASNYFRTNSTAGTIEPVRIWAIGDFGNGVAGQTAVRDAYKNYAGSTYTNVWLWLGDNAYSNGTDAEYQANVFNVYTSQFKNMPLFPSIGNHDYANVGYLSSSALTTNFPYYSVVSNLTGGQSGGVPSGTEKYYSYNYANIHFVALDVYGAQTASGSAQYNWLVNDLSSNTQRWTVIYFHHPPYTKGSHNSDTEAEDIAVRQNLVPVFDTYHVDLVLCGHSHVNERSYLIKGHTGLANTFNTSTMLVQGGSGAPATPYVKSSPFNGTVYATCGTSGQLSGSLQTDAPMACMYLTNNTVNASLVLDVNGDQLDCKYLTGTGTILDQFRIVKSGSRPALAEEDVDSHFSISPNPAHDKLTASFEQELKGSAMISIYNAAGEMVYFSNLNLKSQTLNINLAAGIYIVNADNGEKIYTRKLVIQ
jgi:hypothetical protein